MSISLLESPSLSDETTMTSRELVTLDLAGTLRNAASVHRTGDAEDLIGMVIDVVGTGNCLDEPI